MLPSSSLTEGSDILPLTCMNWLWTCRLCNWTVGVVAVADGAEAVVDAREPDETEEQSGLWPGLQNQQ